MSFQESSDEDTLLSSIKGRSSRVRKEVNYNVDVDEDEDDEAEFDFEEEEAVGNSYADDDEEGEIVEDASDGEDEYDDDDDDEPLSSLKSPSRKKRKSTASASSKNSATKSKKAKSTNSTNKTKSTKNTKTKSKTKNASTTKTKSSSANKKKASTSTSTKSKANTSSDNSSPSAALYSSSKKGQLIAEVLKRWWYGMMWPEPSCIPEMVPLNCDKLDGFPGLYVTTSGEDVGKILDYRNHDDCPNFKNMVRKNCQELKELLISCIKEQRRVLIENEGKGTETEKGLNKLEKWANNVNVDKADKEALKVLKAGGFKLE